MFRLQNPSPLNFENLTQKVNAEAMNYAEAAEDGWQLNIGFYTVVEERCGT